MIIEVIAKATFSYDTEDGIVTDADGALEDVQEMISSGDLPTSWFEYAVGPQKEVTLYLVGADEQEAKDSLLFDSEDSANDYQRDNPWMKVFAVKAYIDYSKLEEVS
jgi:hypothetical protein